MPGGQAMLGNGGESIQYMEKAGSSSRGKLPPFFLLLINLLPFQNIKNEEKEKILLELHLLFV
ncbi:MAG: hypothetical protein D6730_14665 [Bacteroidetes bacterium]|nr:MAG: hypothetical protein D6730_14665 [Bacteroidota bacterium]